MLSRVDSLVGSVIEVEVGPVAHGGHCVARHEGRVVFVRHTLPGERVLARVTEGSDGRRFLRADAIEIIRASADRVAAPCGYAGPGGCGGCDWQHVALEAQRELKAAVVAEQLSRLAGLEVPVRVEAPGSNAEIADGLRWRTRVGFAVDPSGRAGLRRHRSHEVVGLTDCVIAAEALIGTGVLSTQWPGCRVVDAVAPSIGAALVLPDIGAGHPAVRERVETMSWSGEFEVDARGFWQVHPKAAGILLARVLGELAPQAGDRVLDLYAGVGLFAVPLADAVGPAGSVVAVESDPRASRLAAVNSADRPWLQVHSARAERLGPDLGPADLVVLDPPRTGAGREVIDTVCGLGARRVVYVACDPAALARDLRYAADRGYALAGLTAYDLFPMTHHVECVATLDRTASADQVPVR
ncbi:MAG: tRNA/tmRNA/rRNA uracil-C5-methylase [Actinomycetales bacterium]|nr:MAG: tRNA/tmRNA/rRNA uracil-C5-methylase [Actinomycetales bacterium]